MSTTPIPIACTLGPKAAARQSLNWTDLQRHAISTIRLDRGYALDFGPDHVAAVLDLAAREATCCGFLSIATTLVDSGIRIEVTADDPDAVALIDGLVNGSAR